MGANFTVTELAEKVGGTFEGNGGAVLTGLAALGHAQPGDLSFVASKKFAGEAATTGATAVLVPPDWSLPCPAILIRVENPDETFTSIAPDFAPPARVQPPGVHPSALVAEDAVLGQDVSIGPLCIVESGAVIGDRTRLVAACYIGTAVTVGCDGVFYPHVSIREHCTLGDRVVLHDGTVVGSDGFGYVVDEQGRRIKVPQVGIVEIGDDVECGANVTVDRARFGKTRIGNGVKIDNLVQIGHNVIVGDHAVIVAQVGIAGSTEIGTQAIIAGRCGVAGHLSIGAGAIVLGGSGVTRDVPPGVRVFGYPALPHRQAMSLHRHYLRLPQLKDQVAALEKRIAELEGAEAGSSL
jgi:UDP-3-O-[3-hydroxymyristoyl] glucosamine N-acyltransferase